MAGTTAGDGGLDDPDRAWRRPAPGDPPEPAPAAVSQGATAEPISVWAPGGDADRGGVTWVAPSAPPTGSSTEPTGSGAPTAWEPGWSSSGPERAPVVGGMEESGRFGAWSGQPPERTVGVDEHVAGSPRSTTAARPIGGWWVRLGVAAALLAVVVAVAAAVSGDDGPDEAATATSATPAPSTSSPPTTRRPPRTTAPPRFTTTIPATDPASPAELDPADDPRVMLTRLPRGFEPTGAQYGTEFRIVDEIDGMLFAGDGASATAGPWARVQASASVAFAGPTTVLKRPDRDVRIGTTTSGADMVVVETGSGDVAVSSRGLPLETTLALAGAIGTGDDDTWSVPAAAIPPGLRLVADDLRSARPVRMLSVSRVTYRGPDGASVWVTSWLAEERYDRLAVAPFALSDVSYVTIGGEPGVMGVRDLDGLAVRSVQWRRAGVDVELMSTGVDATTALALAGDASTRAELRWGERDWLQAANAEPPDRPAGITVIVEPEVSLGDAGAGPVQVFRSGTMLSWSLDTRSANVGRYASASTSPVLLQVATNPVPATDPGTASHVIALVLGDASIEGATLRVRTGIAAPDGGAGEGAGGEAPVHAIAARTGDLPDSLDLLGYTFGVAVAVPWPQGDFVAELVAADGVTVLATATRADLW